jgi:hypothetical protein
MRRLGRLDYGPRGPMTLGTGARSIFGALAIALGISAAPHVRAGQEPLIVERRAGAAACPDGVALTTLIVRIRGKRAFGAARYHVRFAAKERGYRAVIRADSSGRVRSLQSREATCRSLARATAVTLALLFDSEHEDPQTPEPAPPLRAPPEVPEAPRPSERGRERRAVRADASFALGMSGLAGVLGPVAPGATGEAGILAGNVRAGLGVLWMFPRSLSLGPGEVREDLRAGSARLCYALGRSEKLRLDACSGALAGMMSAEGSGYTRSERQRRPWLAVPVGLEGTLWTGSVGLGLGLSVLVPLHRSDFGIDGVGVAYRSPSAGAMLSFRVLALGRGLLLR